MKKYSIKYSFIDRQGIDNQYVLETDTFLSALSIFLKRRFADNYYVLWENKIKKKEIVRYFNPYKL